MEQKVKVFRSFEELTKKELPRDFTRRCDRRTAEYRADKPVTKAQEKALAAELLKAFAQ